MGRLKGLKRAAGIAAITLVLLEVALRFVLGGAEQGDVYSFHNADGRCVGLKPNGKVRFTGFLFRIPPVTMEVNGLGYRGAERPRAKPPGVFRIAAIGDSFTFGSGVVTGQTIPAHLEHALANPAVEVLNFGVNGANLVDVVPQARIFAAQWNPDLFLFFLFRNDLDEPLCAWSVPPYTLIASAAKHLYVMRIPLLAVLLSQDPKKHPEQRVETLRGGFRSLVAIADSANAKLAVVVLGDPVTREERRISDSASRVLRQTMDVLRVPWLDARMWVSTDSAQHPLPLIPMDGHFTAAGNRMAAERIAQWLQHQGIVPLTPP